MSETGNFSFLTEHSPLFAQLGRSAEQVFSSDPNTTLIKLRQLAEAFSLRRTVVCSTSTFCGVTPKGKGPGLTTSSRSG